MILSYRGQKRTNGECEISISKNSLRTEADTLWAYEETWTINGMLVSQAGTTADIKSKTAALEAVFDREGGDLKLLLADGVSVSHHQIISANTIGGVKILQPPHYTDGKGPQGVTYRRYTVVLAATVPVDTSLATTLLKSFTESLEFGGGGPRFGFLEPALGYPVKQQLKARTTYRVRQTGQAVGLYSRPTIPSPLWPYDQMAAPVVTRGHPRRVGDSYVEWPIAWQYEFESHLPMFGNPHIWGVTY